MVFTSLGTATMTPKLVYLDSSDFSNLSNPDQDLSSENRLVLARLRQHKEAGTAIFFMSAIHLAEAVHAATIYKPAAVRRALLMRELCGTNFLKFATDLPRLELRKVLKGEAFASLTTEELTSQKGEWFGFESSLDSLPDLRRDAMRKIDEVFSKLPRYERRKRKSELNLKKQSSHAKWRELIETSTPATFSDFPFSLVARKATISWFLQELSDKNFREEILKVMRDPYAMFGFLLDATSHRGTLYELVRKQGRDTARDLGKMVSDQFPALTAIAVLGEKVDLTGLMNQACSRPDFLRKFISAYADVGYDHIGDDEVANVVAACPSLSTFIETAKAHLLALSLAHITRIRAGNFSVKEVGHSDFGDLMHSFYAPYFDVFRCDARFGAHLKSQTHLRERIADRITDLLRMLPALPDLSSKPVGRISAA